MIKKYLKAIYHYYLISKSGLFDKKYYLENYPDVRKADIDPIWHFIRWGWRERRNPSSAFNTEHYFLLNPDVNDFNPLIHYILYGKDEKRRIKISNSELEQYSLDPTILTIFDHRKESNFISKAKNSDLYKEIVKNGPLVSIIMPTYNRIDNVRESIQSVLDQSYTNWELLVIDDGSTDGTRDFLENIIFDQRIKIISSNNNEGVSIARNKGLQNSEGKIIAYLDSDNQWTPDYLSIMVSYMLQSKIEIAYSAIRMKNDQGKMLYRGGLYNREKLINKNYIDLNSFCHYKALYYRYGGFDETLKRMVDWDFILRYTKETNPEYVPFIGVNYDDSYRENRITSKESYSWRYVVMNKHLIDWGGLRNNLKSRKNLISIVIPIYNQPSLTDECLRSIIKEPAGKPFELVLVDNGSERETKKLLKEWGKKHKEIKIVNNPENYKFALGCNIGFSVSIGKQVVFLNNDTTVKPGWLTYLVDPLNRKEIGVVQPKLIYPDKTIQCCGIVFSNHSNIGYRIYAGHPGNAPYVNESRCYSAITAACMAVQAKDFIDLKGFDPIYMNGMEDVDFCFRLEEKLNKKSWYTAHTTIIHHESKTKGRGKHIKENRKIFSKRWENKIKPDDLKYYENDGFEIVDFIIEKADKGTDDRINNITPVLKKNNKAKYIKFPNNRRVLHFAIKIPCPEEKQKLEWGDYHFAYSLGKAFERLGHHFRIDFLDNWKSDPLPNEIVLVLRGLSGYIPENNKINLMWLISHPADVKISEMLKYDHIFIASEKYSREISHDLNEKCTTLLQCTDPEVFNTLDNSLPKLYDVLFVGNSRNIYRPLVQEAVKKGVNLSVFGKGWEQFIPKSYIKGENIINSELGFHYCSSRVVLNDHWEDMKNYGFISNRITDVLSCGIPIISDFVSDVPVGFEKYIYFLKNKNELLTAINSALSEPIEIQEKRRKFAKFIHEKHSFYNRAKIILNVVYKIISLGLNS